MIKEDIQKLEPGTIIELFQVDTTPSGGTDILYFHNGVNELGNSVVFNGVVYTKFPILASGFEKTGSGTLPRPTIKVANITGVMGAVIKNLNDLVNSRITRIRTFAKYIDAVNFVSGVNPNADPNQIIDREVWNIDRKASENKVFIEFELTSAFDVQGVQLPRRQVVQNVCPWGYRSAECTYTGGPVADRTDTPTTDITKDACGKRLNSCKLRFGTFAVLPFGGFPATDTNS